MDRAAAPYRFSADIVDEYYERGYWSSETFPDVFERAVDAHPRTPVVGPRRRLNYAALADEASRVAAALRARGIGPGDVVSYQLPNWVTTIAVHIGVSMAGATANPIVPIYRHSEVSYVLDDAGTSCLFIPDTYNGFSYTSMAVDVIQDLDIDPLVVSVSEEAPAVDDGVEIATYDSLCDRDPSTDDSPASSDDVHMLLYTSGTTGDPKGVMHTHNTVLADERAAVARLELTPEGAIFLAAPITHTVGLWATQLPFVAGMGVVLQDGWDPERAVETIRRERCTMSIGATPILREIVDHAPPDGLPLELFACGGADVPPNLIHEASESLGCYVFRLYGSTEHPTVTMPGRDLPIEARANTDGPPAPGVDVRIVDPETGRERPTGDRGELLVRSPELMAGYNQEDLNDPAFEGEWFRTGDLARLNAEGFITLTGRKKDVIVRGGEVISIREVEDHLVEHPAITDIAVVPMPDPRMQEKGCAYVELEIGGSLSLTSMRPFLEAEGIAVQKWPERLEIVESLPRKPNGKIDKAALRADVAKKLDRNPVER